MLSWSALAWHIPKGSSGHILPAILTGFLRPSTSGFVGLQVVHPNKIRTLRPVSPDKGTAFRFHYTRQHCCWDRQWSFDAKDLTLEVERGPCKTMLRGQVVQGDVQTALVLSRVLSLDKLFARSTHRFQLPSFSTSIPSSPHSFDVTGILDLCTRHTIEETRRKTTHNSFERNINPFSNAPGIH